MRAETIKVWDPLVRLFHWSLAGSFLIAWLLEDSWLALHVVVGYTALGLVMVRLLWGLVGPRHARFSDFVRPPAAVWAYLRDVAAFRARRHLGHNPAGGAMVVALLAAVVLTGVTGLATYGAEEFAGPLAVLGHAPVWAGGALEAIHEFLANLTVLLVALHVAGVLLASVQHRENLVRAMVTGRKRTEPINEEATHA